MLISPHQRRRHLAAALLLSAALSLTACGPQRVAASVPKTSPNPSPSPSVSGASPYVEPGANDGAPHHNENNAGRQPRDMSPTSEKDAQREAKRIEPVLKRLWKQGKWDPRTVRSEMLALGYKERTGPHGEQLGGNLDVRGMDPRDESGHSVTPEGAQIGLHVDQDACVTAFVQKTNYQVQVNGPYLEWGCFTPPFAH